MLKKIKVEGKERPFLICMDGMMNLNDPNLTGNESESELKEIGAERIKEIAFSGFKYGALYEDKEIDFTKKDVEKWMMLDMNLWLDVFTAYKEMEPVIADLEKKMMTEGPIQNGQKADTNMNRQQRRKASQKSN